MLAYMKCPKCEGTGKILDPRSFGLEMRNEREKRGISLRKAAGKMGISAAFLSDMERGFRNWTPERIKQFRLICYNP